MKADIKNANKQDKCFISQIIKHIQNETPT